MENQETNEDPCQDDPHPGVGPSACHSRHSIDSDTDVAPHMVTGGPEDVRNRPHMVTRGPEEFRNRPHKTTGSQEQTPFCSLGTCSGKQQKASSTSEPHFQVKTPLRQLKQTRFC